MIADGGGGGCVVDATSRSFHQYIYKLNEIKVKLFPPENDW